MPLAKVVVFHVHWEISMCCVKHTFVLSADGATAATAPPVKAPSLPADSLCITKDKKEGFSLWLP